MIPVLIVLFTWSLNEQSKAQWEQYKRKEASYVQLLKSLRGFYVSSYDLELRRKFIEELEKCWLYAPDQVIEKGYVFLNSVRKGKSKTKEEKEKAVGEFVLAIRKDLLSRKIVDETEFEPKDFQLIKALGK